MKLNKIIRTLVILAIVIINVSCDQISKSVVRKKVAYHENIEIVKNQSGSILFRLTKIENTGAFLSFGNEFPQAVKNVVFKGLPLLALLLVLGFVVKNTKINNGMLVGICFAIGGGLGNLFDRIMYGSVTDFLYIDLTFFRTGIFNMADVSLMVGFFIIMAENFRKRILT